MLGAIIGDIVGSRFEFNNHRSKDFELFHKDCSYTDDTICTVAVADAIMRNRSFDRMLRYWCRAFPYPNGGYGSNFNAWINSNMGPYYSYGNGAAMRVSPCAWLAEGRRQTLDYTYQATSCTHDHPEGLAGAHAVVECIMMARKRMTKSQIKADIKEQFGYFLDFTCDEIRPVNRFDETCQVTVPQAIVCFLESNDFEDCIRNAVSIGGDSDTIAAIAGSIAEMYYGIPEWMEKKALEYLTDEMIEVYNRFKTNKK